MLTPWYVTGFCDGEAVFTYSRSGGTFSIYFSITQKESNRQILENIRGYFNFVGGLYQRGKATAYYRVTKINELQRIVEHFDKYPLQSQKKQEAFTIWRQMVMYKTDNYRNIDYNTLRDLTEKLSKLNSQSRAFSRPTIKAGGIPPEAGKIHKK